MSDTVTAPTVPDIDIDIGLEFVVMGDEEREHPFRVIIHNDDVTPMDFVIKVLMNFFDLPFRKAIIVMYKAHRSGQALVTVLPYHKAHDKVYNAQSAARQFGYPLSFTLEPEDAI
ncbi:MAG: hypothetical protein B6242_09675 [Anaerolineaceae bacterium 4572_78]|nr:MAG: hypothetical protein B6242_09675 [Anaerolineaceae bacterium 4572_78]